MYRNNPILEEREQYRLANLNLDDDDHTEPLSKGYDDEDEDFDDDNDDDDDDLVSIKTILPRFKADVVMVVSRFTAPSDLDDSESAELTFYDQVFNNEVDSNMGDEIIFQLALEKANAEKESYFLWTYVILGMVVSIVPFYVLSKN